VTLASNLGSAPLHPGLVLVQLRLPLVHVLLLREKLVEMRKSFFVFLPLVFDQFIASVDLTLRPLFLGPNFVITLLWFLLEVLQFEGLLLEASAMFRSFQ
jgi:hypothetical protein